MHESSYSGEWHPLTPFLHQVTMFAGLMRFRFRCGRILRRVSGQRLPARYNTLLSSPLPGATCFRFINARFKNQTYSVFRDSAPPVARSPCVRGPAIHDRVYPCPCFVGAYVRGARFPSSVRALCGDGGGAWQVLPESLGNHFLLKVVAGGFPAPRIPAGGGVSGVFRPCVLMFAWLWGTSEVFTPSSGGFSPSGRIRGTAGGVASVSVIALSCIPPILSNIGG